MTVPTNEDLQNHFKMVLHWYSHTNLKPLGNAALSPVSTPVRDTFYLVRALVSLQENN